MSRKPKLFTILQMDERRIRAVKVRPSDQGVDIVETATTAAAGSGTEPRETVLRKLAAAHRLTDGPVYLVLPRHEVTTRILVLPSHEEREIGGMVRLNAEEYVPYPVEDLVIDAAVLQRLPDGQSRVLAVFAPREPLEEHLNALRQAGMRPEGVYLSTTCLAAAALASRPPVEEPYALLDVSSGGVEVLVLQGRRFLYGRAAASHRSGPLESVPPEELAEEAAIELRASLAAFRRESEDEATIDRVYLASETADPSALCEHVAGQTGYPCESAAPFTRSIVKDGASASDVSLAALGAALVVQGRAPLAIDLTPETVREAREAARRRRTLAGLGGIAAALIILIGAGYALEVHQRRAYIEDLRALEREYAPEAESVRQRSRQLSILQRQIDPTGSALEILARVTEKAPADEINFLQFTYDRGQKAVIRGRAMTPQLVDRLTQDLRELGGFYATAQRGGNTTVPEWDRQVTEYVITIDLTREPAEGDEEATAVDEGEEVYDVE